MKEVMQYVDENQERFIDDLKNWMGIPVVSGGGVSYAQATIHAPNENIRLDDYIRSIKFLTTLMSRCR